MSSTDAAVDPLRQALRLQTDAAAQGFDWPQIGPVIDKLEEELAELRAEIQAPKRDPQRLQEELGDLLFSVVNLARHLQLAPDQALAAGNAKFAARFAQVMAAAEQLPALGDPRRLDAMEARWLAAKAAE